AWNVQWCWTGADDLPRDHGGARWTDLGGKSIRWWDGLALHPPAGGHAASRGHSPGNGQCPTASAQCALRDARTSYRRQALAENPPTVLGIDDEAQIRNGRASNCHQIYYSF